jgi:hypothetical protein
MPPTPLFRGEGLLEFGYGRGAHVAPKNECEFGGMSPGEALRLGKRAFFMCEPMSVGLSSGAATSGKRAYCSEAQMPCQRRFRWESL